jgi:hypothetical protein
VVGALVNALGIQNAPSKKPEGESVNQAAA